VFFVAFFAALDVFRHPKYRSMGRLMGRKGRFGERFERSLVLIAQPIDRQGECSRISSDGIDQTLFPRILVLYSSHIRVFDPEMEAFSTGLTEYIRKHLRDS
jgi:hypothetical protein